MKEPKLDLRIVKTKKLLYEALIELLKTNSFEDLKVSDICEKALINRSTFYAHYEDKYDLMATFIKDVTKSLEKELEANHNISNTREYYIEMLSIFLDHVSQKKDFYSSIVINNKNSVIMDMIYDILNKDIIKHLENNNVTIPLDIISNFYLGAVVNVAMELFCNSNKYTKEEIIKYISNLIPDSI